MTGTIDIPGSTSSPQPPSECVWSTPTCRRSLRWRLQARSTGRSNWSSIPRVTVTLTYTLATPTFREVVAESDWAGVEPWSAVVTTLTSVLGETLTNLKQFWEQPSPPAHLASGEPPLSTVHFPRDQPPSRGDHSSYPQLGTAVGANRCVINGACHLHTLRMSGPP